MVFAGHDLADEDLVVAAGQDVDDPAIEKRQAISQDRRAGDAAVIVFKSVKSFGPGSRKPARDLLLVEPQDVDGEAAILLEVVERMSARLSTATSTSGGSSESDATALAVRPCRPASPPVVTTVTPGGKLAHDLPLFLGIKCHEWDPSEDSSVVGARRAG